MPIPFPANPLYHYSSLAELTALLDNQSIILTPIDSSGDLNTALSLIQDVIVNTYPGLSPDSFSLDGSLPAYSYSFAAQKDSANRWQEFYPDGGFSLSIDPAQLSAVMDTYNLTLMLCLYDDGAKKDFILNTIVASTPEQLDPQSAMVERKIKEINRNIVNYAGLLKDISRKDEQEWRIMTYYVWPQLVGGPGDIPPDPLLLDVLNNSIAAPLASASFSTVNIEEIVIGPHQDMVQAKADCEQLLTDHGLTNVVVTESGLPYQ